MKFYNINTALIVFVTGIFLASCSHEQPAAKQPSPVVVTLAQPAKQNTASFTTSGQLQSAETAVISTRVMGYITSVHVKQGVEVTKGQLLVSISNSDILARKAQIQAMVTETEAALTDAQKDMDRYTELYRQQSASTKELESITLRYQSMKAKSETAKQMQREAEAMLAYTNITAPFAGVITQKMADVGSLANPGMPLLILEKKRNYEVATSVTEAEIEYIKAGTPVVTLLKATGKSIIGTVTEISPSSTGSGGRYDVKISVPENESKGLYAGMSVRVTFKVAGAASASESLLVPASALVYKDQLVGLYTVSEGNTALLRWLRLGKTYHHQIEVLSGLQANEQFILKAEGKLYNGVPVRTDSK